MCWHGKQKKGFYGWNSIKLCLIYDFKRKNSELNVLMQAILKLTLFLIMLGVFHLTLFLRFVRATYPPSQPAWRPLLHALATPFKFGLFWFKIEEDLFWDLYGVLIFNYNQSNPVIWFVSSMYGKMITNRTLRWAKFQYVNLYANIQWCGQVVMWLNWWRTLWFISMWTLFPALSLTTKICAYKYWYGWLLTVTHAQQILFFLSFLCLFSSFNST